MANEQNARACIAEQTRDAHERLHVHADIRRLFAKDLRDNEYAALIHAYWQFYRCFERQRQRLDCWHTLSLSQAIGALARDRAFFGDTHCVGQAPVRASFADTAPVTTDASAALLEAISAPELCFIRDPIDCLAGLYVLHGATAGATVISRQLEKNVPKLPRAYFSLPRDAELWQALVDALESYADDSDVLQRLCESANQTFDEFGRWVTQCCEQVCIAVEPA